MFAKLAKLAEPRTIESRRAMLGARRLIHSGDNRRSVGPNSAGEQNRRQMLVCSWHWGPGDGRLECSWHIEPADDSLGDRAGRWSPIANAHRAHDSHAKDSIDTEHCDGARAAHDRNSPGNRKWLFPSRRWAPASACSRCGSTTSRGSSRQPLSYFLLTHITKTIYTRKFGQMALISTSGADQERTKYVVQQAHLSTTFEPARRLGAIGLLRLATWLLRRAVNWYERGISSIVVQVVLFAVRFLERSEAVLAFRHRPRNGPKEGDGSHRQ
jgi:hypothetical protein